MENFESILQGRNTSLDIQELFEQNHWPEKDKKLEWTIIFETLINKKKLSNSLNSSNATLSILHRKLKQFFTTGNEQYIISDSRYIYLICQNLDNPNMGTPTLLDSNYADKLKQLLECISNQTENFDEIFIPLLEVWLRSLGDNEQLKKCIITISDYFKSHKICVFSNIMDDLDLYLDKNYAEKTITKNETSDDFTNEFLEHGIENKYTQYPYLFFHQFFFNWIITRNTYTLDLLDKYFNEIQLCTLDQQKIISARFLIYFDKQDNKNYIQQYLDKMKMYSATKKEYWNLTNAEYNEKYNTIMNEVYEVVKPMITVDFISYIFSYFGDQPEIDDRRLRFWISYSKSIKTIKYFMGQSNLNKLERYILDTKTLKAQDYSNLLRNNWIEDRDKKSNTTALMLSFGNLFIIEFIEGSKPIQIFQPTNKKIANYFNGDNFTGTINDVHVYNDHDEKDMFKYNPDAEEGTLSHRGNWEKEMESILGNYRIYKDTCTIGKRPAPFYRDLEKGIKLKKAHEFEKKSNMYFSMIKNEINFYRTKMNNHDITDENTKTILLNISKENIPENTLAYDLFKQLVMEECLRHTYTQEDITEVSAKLKYILHTLNINGDYLGRLSRMIFYK